VSESRPCAVIDVGSNTVRLLVALPRDGTLEPLVDDSAFVRLGFGVDGSGALNPDRERAALEAIRRLADRARSLDADPVLSIATSAVRDARNRDSFVQKVREQAGVQMEVISGNREAELTHRGAMLGVQVEDGVVVCDLGGGSAELIHAEADAIRWAVSEPLGSGRLSERFVREDPPTAEEQEAVRAYVAEVLDALPPARVGVAIFTGGTARHIALLAGVQGARVSLTVDQLKAVQRLVCAQPASRVVEQYGVQEERARVLPAGVTAIVAMADYYAAPDIIITQQGIREGTIIDYLERHGAWPKHRR